MISNYLKDDTNKKGFIKWKEVLSNEKGDIKWIKSWYQMIYKQN